MGKASESQCGPKSLEKFPSLLVLECNPCKVCFSGVGWSQCIYEQEGKHAGINTALKFFTSALNFEGKGKGITEGAERNSSFSWGLSPFRRESSLGGQGKAMERHPPQPSGHHDGNAVTNGLGLGQAVSGQEGPLLCVFDGCLDHLPEVIENKNQETKHH